MDIIYCSLTLPILFSSTLPYSTLLNSTLLYSSKLDSTLIYSNLIYSTLLYSTPLNSTLLYSTLLYSNPLNSTLFYPILLDCTLLYYLHPVMLQDPIQNSDVVSMLLICWPYMCSPRRLFHSVVRHMHQVRDFTYIYIYNPHIILDSFFSFFGG